MRKITADYIFPISSEPIANGVIVLDDDGAILDVYPQDTTTYADSSIEKHKGIICPGFVNTHCHLELSYLKNQITVNTRMAGFIEELLVKRNTFKKKEIQKSIVAAEKKMFVNGIVAVGDICNTNLTFKQKAKGKLLYHTFIELFDLSSGKVKEVMMGGKALQKEYEKAFKQAAKNRKPKTENRSSIVPHAPYTVSPNLLDVINEVANRDTVISIHNQESKAEEELFFSKSGELYTAFTKMGIKLDYIKGNFGSSIVYTLSHLMNSGKIILVHNTFTTKGDVSFIKSQTANYKSKIYLCTCPNANMFIENKLPDYGLFIKEGMTITIGTDSLASNWSLSILDELKTISKHFPTISLQTLLTWATLNGSVALGFTQLGSIEKGKKPGINLLQNTDVLRLTKDTKVKRLA